VAVRWRTKAIANTFGLWGFITAYFWIQNHPQFELTHMPLTALDYWIPYIAPAIVPYASLWLYVSLPLALLTRPSEFKWFGIGAATLSIAGLGCFYLWPTAVPVVAGWTPETASFLRNVDGPGNACPSLHVAFAVFSWAWLRRLIADVGGRTSIRIGNAAWCWAIILSTLAIRQHVVIDVVAGAALGAAVAALTMGRLRRKSNPVPAAGPADFAANQVRS
jgi:membrane-associated phospholipid phosphatase